MTAPVVGKPVHARARVKSVVAKAARGPARARWVAGKRAIAAGQAARIALAIAVFRQAQVVVRPGEVALARLVAAVRPPAGLEPEQAAHAAPPARVAVPAAAAVAGGGSEKAMTKENSMNTKTSNVIASNILLAVLAMVSCFVLAAPSQAQPQSQTAQKAFATPKEAADALIQAASDFNVPTLLEILGQDGKDLVASEDTVQDKNRAAAFAAKAKEKTEVVIGPNNKALATLTVGSDDWPRSHSHDQEEWKVVFRFQIRARRDFEAAHRSQ